MEDFQNLRLEIDKITDAYAIAQKKLNDGMKHLPANKKKEMLNLVNEIENAKFNQDQNKLYDLMTLISKMNV